MTNFTSISRRDFIRVSVLAGGGLLVACGGGSGSSNGGTPDNPTDNNGSPTTPAETYGVGEFMRISTDNKITILVGAAEIGQGSLTAIPMIVAEELDADWSQVSAELSPVAANFNNPYFQNLLQFTVASSSIRGYFDAQRTVGAAVRQMLVNAAAKRWAVAASSLRTESGYVIDDTNGRTASYGELSSAAAEESVPVNPSLKDPASYTLIGTSTQRLDAANKTDGSFQYGIDVDIPNMLTAVIARPPRFNGQALNVDDNAALAIPGVHSVHTILGGVAVIADDFWAADKGRKALNVEWNELLAGRTDSDIQRSTYDLRLNLPGVPIRSDGLVLLAQTLASETISADYYFPFMAHAAMEPLNVVVDYDGSSAEIWTGTQSATLDKVFAGLTLGLLPNQITFHTMPSGGGFGRRGNPLADYVRDACAVAKELRQPVKVMWTREDDMKGGFYRPAASVRVSASIDSDNNISAWTHRAVTQDVTALLYSENLLDNLADFTLPPLKELTDFETGMPYDIDNVLMDAHLTVNLSMPALWMRSVNKFSDVFAQETFVDELALKVGKNPYNFRYDLLSEKPRHRAVLEAAANAASWGFSPSGTSQGIAVMGHWNSFVAQVVDISVSADREITVHKVVSAVDCGTAINPDLVKAQVESAVVFALSSIFFGEILLEDGVVQQSNFDDYPVLRMYQTPVIETIIIDSQNPVGGVGELGVPCVGPALANAIFNAIGERIRELPLTRSNFKIA
ncbi:Isoquinoline 1-oxidoreductase subunit beta [Zhongshania aliphaticivorans]|uniref:Isoquinoline 1-oxidoreductase subunit beta n=1 Tax=Zhongshania aliphaticivorans TaxID=1470434 RepID=A0A5S9NV07_9GAMM|nr:molybdopterin cofactor-binding domain-containing protein [Zhongshania aliphaticivorans]CAA0094483.1 Isoquinoline 1-oxidoreductase subunit beta [Zhongshania aliphaticivorans]CAA0112513.1 Isoquinoline 1-oxidoreductase subunit beta [Zhongshania aliphaticivorans]